MQKLSLKDAQAKFNDFLAGIRPKDVAPFLKWVGDSFSVEREQQKPKFIRDASEKIAEISMHLRERVPSGGTFSSESILWPSAGYDSDCNQKNTVHVDCFLYDDDDVEELVTDGKLTRSYCNQCGSKDTKALTFISHSLAPVQLEFMFTQLVPLKVQIEGFEIVDIGSRLGSVVYAASLYGLGKCHVTGVELNEDLCKLQKNIIGEFSLENIDVVASDVRNQPEVLEKADLVVMNNVFSFFLSMDEQASCWNVIHDNLKPGCLIIHNPDMAEIINHLELPFKLEDWLEKIPIETQCAMFAGDNETVFEDCANLSFYKVRDINS